MTPTPQTEAGRLADLETKNWDLQSQLDIARSAVRELEARLFQAENAVAILRISNDRYEQDAANPPAYLQDAVIRAAGLGALHEQRDAAIRERDQLRAQVDDIEAERDEALRRPWPEWATSIMNIVREHSGYDGFDDADGVDLPEEVREHCEAINAEVQEQARLLGISAERELALRAQVERLQGGEAVAVIGSGFQLLWCRQDWSKGLKVGDKLYTAQPAAPALVPLIARQIGEWHEDDGAVMWWAWNGREWAGEPAWCGTPNDSDWPGYHTHWTPHPAQPVGIGQPVGGEAK